MDITEMRILSSKSVEGIRLETTDEIFRDCEASWLYPGVKGEPHALLTSGLHSNGYLNVNQVTMFPNYREVLAERLIEKIQQITKEKIDAVISSSSAGIHIGGEVARQLGVVSLFTEKKDKDQVWSGRFDLSPGARILQIEDLITTLGTARKVREAVSELPGIELLREDNKILLGVVVHRPAKLQEYLDYKVVSLWDLEIHNWKPEECPLCKNGSVALKPKPNWQEFQRFMRMKE